MPQTGSENEKSSATRRNSWRAKRDQEDRVTQPAATAGIAWTDVTVPDAAAARDFYAAVTGMGHVEWRWTATPISR